jgi:hypothetical protein
LLTSTKLLKVASRKKILSKKSTSWKNANFEKTGTLSKQTGNILKFANHVQFTFWPPRL